MSHVFQNSISTRYSESIQRPLITILSAANLPHLSQLLQPPPSSPDKPRASLGRSSKPLCLPPTPRPAGEPAVLPGSTARSQPMDNTASAQHTSIRDTRGRLQWEASRHLELFGSNCCSGMLFRGQGKKLKSVINIRNNLERPTRRSLPLTKLCTC